MAASQIRFSSFQDIDYVFGIQTDRQITTSQPQSQAQHFSELFLRLKSIASIYADPIPNIIIKTPLNTKPHKAQKQQRTPIKQKNKEFLSNVRPEKLKNLSGNKLQKQTSQSPYIKQLTQLRHQIVSSFTRIEIQLDKSIDQSFCKQNKVTKINKSMQKSSEKQSTTSRVRHSTKNSGIFSSRTPRESIRSSFVHNLQKTTPRKSIQKQDISQIQKKQHFSPSTIKISLDKFCKFPPSNSILIKQQKHSIANKSQFRPFGKK